MTLPLPPQALDLLNSLDDKLAVTDAVVDIVDVRKSQTREGQDAQDLLVRGRDGKERTITLTDFGEFEMRRGQQMYGLFVGDTAVMLYNTRTHKQLLLPGVDAETKRGLLERAIDPLDIVRIVRGFATDPEVAGGGSRALRELKSNIEKILAERAAKGSSSGAMRIVLGGLLIALLAGGGIYFGYDLIAGGSKPVVSIGNPPHVPGTPLVAYLDLVQLTLEETRAGADPKDGTAVCELVGSVYNRMGRKIDKLNFNGRMRETVVAFTIEGVDKSAEKRGIVIGRHPGACLESYKDRYELSEPQCVLDGVVWKGCRDVIRILF
ncbi:MAG: hypothetical protein KF889_20450 [Alphaproteobacteria bacterium]|nr:hypothetical protein [Alphaproteobacteria bacterium]MCW5744227.1 hypothetical protein [Alphaproteobacteria bacterium]